MNCCFCKNHPKFICSCISPSVFICNEHLDLHTSGPGDHMHRVSISNLIQWLKDDKSTDYSKFWFENQEDTRTNKDQYQGNQ